MPPSATPIMVRHMAAAHRRPGQAGRIKDKDLGTIFKTVCHDAHLDRRGRERPLYGTFFLMPVRAPMESQRWTQEELVTVFSAGLQGLNESRQGRGRGNTMVGALGPALAALKPVGDDSVPLPSIARSLPLKRSRFTRAIVPKKGRASYHGRA